MKEFSTISAARNYVNSIAPELPEIHRSEDENAKYTIFGVDAYPFNEIRIIEFLEDGRIFVDDTYTAAAAAGVKAQRRKPARVKSTYKVEDPHAVRNSAASIRYMLEVRRLIDEVPVDVMKSWHVSISSGNSKMGTVYNVSLVPVITCPHCGECCKECYAIRAFQRLGKSTGEYIEKLYNNAWFRNTCIYFRDRSRYYDEIRAAMAEIVEESRADLRGRGFDDAAIDAPGVVLAWFRWHVSGDFEDADYFKFAVSLAAAFPGVRFLGFTKAYDSVNNFEDAGGAIPSNFSVPFSIWSGMPCDNRHNHGEVHLNYADPARATYHGDPAKAWTCNGNCEKCGRSGGGCFNLKPGGVVLINQH